jgi:hypothetical protein
MALPSLITDAELLQLSLAASALNGMASAVRDAHRQTASDTVRSRLAPRISAAVSEGYAPGSDVKGVVAAFAAYSLLAFRGYNPERGADKAVLARYNDALKWIDDVLACRAEPVEGGAIDRGAPQVSGESPPEWSNWRRRSLPRFNF